MNIKLIDEKCMPSYNNPTDSGFDLRSRIPVTLKPNERILIPTGVCVEIDNGFEIQVRSRSGLALKHGCFVLNSPGTIDSGYTGEICVILMNLGNEEVHFPQYSRVAQAVICQVHQCQFFVTENLDTTSRGEKGFGSSGIS